MLNMLPGNPFPQICVVSVVSCTKGTLWVQEYLSSMVTGNPHWAFGVTKTRQLRCDDLAGRPTSAQMIR
jgi:hypothetical protein